MSDVQHENQSLSEIKTVDSACKQLKMALSQAHNLLSPYYLSGDLTNDYVNNFISFIK